MKIVFAKATSSIGNGLVRKGTHWPADDPIVKAHPDMFSDDPRYGLAYSVEPKEGLNSDDEVVVETATAAPGEKRQTRRG